MSAMTVERLMRYAVEDPRYIIESGFSVINKNKDVVPFIFNPIQNAYYEARTYRDDITKASQLGMSTEILAILATKFLLVPNSWSVSISHEGEATTRLFGKVDFFLSHLPLWLRPFLKRGKDSASVITNEVMNSQIYIGTAGSRVFGRGDTIHFAHFSETAFYRDSQVVTNVMRAMPQDKINTWAVKESTANGEGTPQHQEYLKALGIGGKNGNEKSEFTAHFFPFFDNPDYRIKGAEIHNYTAEERALVSNFPGKIDEEVLAWRRGQIGSLPSEAGRTSEEMFRQEFPTTWQEAFLTSGNPVFSRNQLAEMEENCKNPIRRGNLIGNKQSVSFVDNEDGYIQIFEEPKPDGQYIVGGDVGKSHDRCVGVVVDKQTWHTVAKFIGVMKPFDFGDELTRIGYYYNSAKLIPEINNMGQSTVDRIVQLRYPDIFIRKTKKKNTKTNTVEEIDDYGWYTTGKTKSLIIGNMQGLTNSGEAYIFDKEIIGEMKTYVKVVDSNGMDTGQMEASSGNFDDQVMAVCIAYYGLKLFPYTPLATTNSNVIAKRVSKYKQFRRGKLTKRQ